MITIDPNKTLAELRRLAKDVLEGEYAIGDDPAYEMANLIEYLDEWISEGGFLPTDWNK